jgi:hypothetical protein
MQWEFHQTPNQAMAEALCGFIKFESRSPFEQLLEGDPRLEPSQWGPETEVDSPAESRMATRGFAFHVDRIGVLEAFAVVIGCRPQQHQSCVGRKGDAGQFCVTVTRR